MGQAGLGEFPSTLLGYIDLRESANDWVLEWRVVEAHGDVTP
jgi:hypothetical protein